MLLPSVVDAEKGSGFDGCIQSGACASPSNDVRVELASSVPSATRGVPGYALLQRMGMQRELDVTPSRTVVVLFAPPAEEGT